MKEKIMFLNDFAIADEIAEGILAKAQNAFDSSNRMCKAVYQKDCTFPKRWGGYLFPLRIQQLNQVELTKVTHQLMDELSDECIVKAASHFYKDSKNFKQPAIRVALVKKCKRFPKSGILVYWER